MSKFLLGPLEQEVMDCVWRDKKVTVRDVYSCIRSRRKIAYTTVMTILARLVSKGFLLRKKQGKAYLYYSKKSKRESIRMIINKVMNSFIDQFGEEAIVAFSDEVEKLSSKEQ